MGSVEPPVAIDDRARLCDKRSGSSHASRGPGARTARFLVSRNIVGFVIGRGGTKIREMREQTGANIQFRDAEEEKGVQLQEEERVLEVRGDADQRNQAACATPGSYVGMAHTALPLSAALRSPLSRWPLCCPCRCVCSRRFSVLSSGAPPQRLLLCSFLLSPGQLRYNSTQFGAPWVVWSGRPPSPFFETCSRILTKKYSFAARRASGTVARQLLAKLVLAGRGAGQDLDKCAKIAHEGVLGVMQRGLQDGAALDEPS